MEPKEQKLLEALAYMVAQYLGDDEIDLICSYAGGRAVELLVEYGLVEPQSAQIGRWTEAGTAFLATH